MEAKQGWEKGRELGMKGFKDEQMVSPKGRSATTTSCCTTRKTISGKIEKRAQQRLSGIEKKIHELSVLCCVEACLIYLPSHDKIHNEQPIPLTWPKNENSLRSVIHRYQSYTEEGKKKKNQKKRRSGQEPRLSSACSHSSVSSNIIESRPAAGGGFVDFDLHFGSPEEIVQANQGLVQSGCANLPACNSFCDDYVADYEQQMASVFDDLPSLDDSGFTTISSDTCDGCSLQEVQRMDQGMATTSENLPACLSFCDHDNEERMMADAFEDHLWMIP